MLITEMPGFLEPTVAVFPFPWYENHGLWMLYALKIQPDLNLKWRRHFSDNGRGHAKAEIYNSYEQARAVVCQFNVGIEHRVSSIIQSEETRLSLLLKAEKEITRQQRLTNEEQLMLTESLRRNRFFRPPDKDILILPKWSDEGELRDELHQLLCEAPKLSIAQLTTRRITLLRKGEYDWSHVVATNKTTGRKYLETE